MAVFAVKQVASLIFFDGDHAGLLGFVGGVGVESADFTARAIGGSLAGFVATRFKLADAKAVETGFAVALLFDRVDVFFASLTQLDVGHGRLAFVVAASQGVVFGIIAFAELAFVAVARAAFFGANQADFFAEGFIPTDFTAWTIRISSTGLDAAIVAFRQFNAEQTCFAIALFVATGGTARLADIPSCGGALGAFPFDAVHGRIDKVFITTRTHRRTACLAFFG